MHFYLAPMEGLTTYTFRTAYHHYFTGIDKYFTPFISNRNLSSRERNDILPEHNAGMQLVPQILTNRADEFLEIAEIIAGYGYDTVNLNLGCPSGTVVSKGRGAGFLRNPDELRKFLDTVYEKCPIKVSIKTRIGVESTEEWETLLKLFSGYPIAELIIHPRLLKEFYKGQPHKAAYRQAKELLTVPLCYNGDIVSRESLTELTRELPKTDTVMIGRGILQRPTLPAELKRTACLQADTTTQPDTQLSAGDLSATLRDFHNELLEGYCRIMPGEQPTLFKMKDFWTFFSCGFESPERYLKKVKKATRLSEYKTAVRELFQSCPYRQT